MSGHHRKTLRDPKKKKNKTMDTTYCKDTKLAILDKDKASLDNGVIYNSSIKRLWVMVEYSSYFFLFLFPYHSLPTAIQEPN